MNSQIRNLAELKAEVTRLTERRSQLEQKIQSDVRDLAEQLKPVNLIKNAFSSVAGDGDLRNKFAARGAEAAISFIISNLVFKKANGAIKAIATLVGTSVINQFFGEDGTKYISKVTDFFKKFIGKKKDDTSPPDFNEVDVYRTD